MATFVVSEAWKKAYPGAWAGILVMHGVVNPEGHPALEQRRGELEQQLRERYAGRDKAAFKSIPAIQAYNAYYARYGKTYHVQLQLESVALKGRSISRSAALVQAMFMAEVKNLVLTAGHDLEAIGMPVTLDVASGNERYTLLNGQEQVLKPGDMMMSDLQGVISSVLYGPDGRTRITANTRHVLFAVYAPAGIAAVAVREHLQDIKAYVQLVAPRAEVESLEVYGTG
jgi:DNA/RNA-binding domain of Phe-tRNA-synthetase-like protein